MGSVCQELVVSVYAEVWILREASVVTTWNNTLSSEGERRSLITPHLCFQVLTFLQGTGQSLKFPIIEREESTETTEGLRLLQGPPLTQFPLLSLALRPHCPSSSPPPQGWSGKESPSLIPLNVPPLPPPHH